MSSCMCQRSYDLRMMECAFQTCELRNSCLGVLGPQGVHRRKRTWLSLLNLGRPLKPTETNLAIYPESLGSALALPLTGCLIFLGLRLLIYKTEYIISTYRVVRTILYVIGPCKMKLLNECLQRKRTKCMANEDYLLEERRLGRFFCGCSPCLSKYHVSALRLILYCFMTSGPRGLSRIIQSIPPITEGKLRLREGK